jgi:PPOX class probable FMN-dependent enzyme
VADAFGDLCSDAVIDHDELSAIYGPPHDTVVRKVTDRINEQTAAYVSATSLVFLATYSRDGRCDVTPRGGAPGFVKILDERTLAIPDVPGNRRLDTMHNILATGRIGAIFVIPGRTDGVRFNGRACVSTRPDLLARFDAGRKSPVVAIVIQTDEIFIHCASALNRSNAWRPDKWLDKGTAPGMNELWKSHLVDNGVEI